MLAQMGRTGGFKYGNLIAAAGEYGSLGYLFHSVYALSCIYKDVVSYLRTSFLNEPRPVVSGICLRNSFCDRTFFLVYL